MRHYVRMKHASIINYAGPVYPWSEDLKIGKLFMQIPFREYYNQVHELCDHLDDWFIENTRVNAKRWIDRYGKVAEAFDGAYDPDVV